MSLEGQILDGKYAIVRRIAEGGTSTVYLGVNQRIGKDVAVKVLHSGVARDPEVLERFEREARAVSRIRSPHVADVFDFGELETGARFMVMEYLEGDSLATLIEREGTIAPRTLATIAAQILDALAAAHAAGVIHRDLKPENVIVTTRGRDVIVKVVDFGISKIVDSMNVNLARVTAAGAVLGTPLYMSPEQARGQTNLIDHRTDLFSLGVMLYEATAGEPPLTGDNVNDLLFRVALDEPEPLTVRVPSVDPALATIVRRAMAKDLVDRYQSAEEMREAVEEWRARFTSGVVSPASLDGIAVSSSASTSRPSSRPRFGRARRMAIAAPLVATAIGIGIVMGAPIVRRDLAAATKQPPAPAATPPAPAATPPAPAPAPAPVPAREEPSFAVPPPAAAPPVEPPAAQRARPSPAAHAAPAHPARRSAPEKLEIAARDAGPLLSVADIDTSSMGVLEPLPPPTNE